MKRIKNRHKNEQGFTIVDLVITISIVMVMTVVMIVAFSVQAENQRDKTNSEQSSENVEVSPDFYPSETN